MSIYQKFFKRAIDIVISFLGMVILSPLYLILSIYVLVFMGKPLLFAQERIGKNEKPFRLYKFRSMTNRRDKDGNLLPENDRLTKPGIWLRNSSLDELPELWSIFIGKMSIVGPRPMPTYYAPYFYPEERKRHSIRGGLIPPDSLSGKTVTSYEEQFRYECEYADSISLMTDIKVVFNTFKILFLRVKDDYGTCERPHLNIYRQNIIK